MGPRSVAADIALLDAGGATVAELIDCWFVAVPTGTPAQTDLTFWTAYIPSARQPPPRRICSGGCLPAWRDRKSCRRAYCSPTPSPPPLRLRPLRRAPMRTAR